MRASVFLVLLAVIGCGPPDFVGSWAGTITAGGTGGSGSYQDTWNISRAGAGTLQILTTGTCTSWTATEGSSIATWATTCGGDPFNGSLQFVGPNLQAQFTIHGPYGSASGSGLLTRQ